jgi:hypothetical protein
VGRGAEKKKAVTKRKSEYFRDCRDERRKIRTSFQPSEDCPLVGQVDLVEDLRKEEGRVSNM